MSVTMKCDKCGHGKSNHRWNGCVSCHFNVPGTPSPSPCAPSSISQKLTWYTDHDPGSYCDRVHPLVDHDTWQRGG